ncbi:MAG: BamA/TamA family outer membrane protein [Ignavibacteriae bacterium]|nr:BamA/TamA family outer membrane protein [Ignavibacteriota bacterium]
MINIFKKKITYQVLRFLSLIIIVNINSLIAQNNQTHTLIPSHVNKFQYEIGAIKFTGNKAFSSADLQNLILSRPTDRSYEHRILLYYDVQLKYPYAKKIIPPIMINAFDMALQTMINEVQFFEQTKAENDVLTIQDYYNWNGFHKAKVNYTFEADKSGILNILTFFIAEDSASTIGSLSYNGLDSLPPDLESGINSLRKVRVGERYGESKLNNEIRTIHFKLLDNGYYNSKFDIPLVIKDTINNTDSIIINFHTGKRYKIAGINYIDSTKGQNLVVNEMKDKQLDFGIGDWYSISKINRSNNNLLSLGTFDIVNIDTSSIFKPQTDSTLSMLVFTQYRKQQEWGAGIYVNRTAFDNFTNIGLELSYSHRNFGGVAQNFNIFGRGEVHDISRWKPPDFQFQLGINFSQPLLFNFDRARFGLAWQFILSYSNIFTDLKLGTISFPIKLPVKFPEFTFIQFGSIDLLIEKQIPIDFDNAYQKALDEAVNDVEREKVINSYKIYESLNKYSKKTWFPSAVIIGGSLTGDTRNDIFNPSSGYYFNTSADAFGGLGIAKFIRFLMSYYLFSRLSPTTVFAFKVKGGLTVWGDQIDTYVPFERQFFAGGANSVRGWASRRLRYPQPKGEEYQLETFNFVQDFVGSGAILEGTFELRFRFPRPANFDKLISEIISNIGLTAFIDWGNTFHWYSDYNYQYKWYDYFTKLAVSGGVGFGYMTPVGPFRIDFALPIYDPSALRDQTILTRENVIKDLKIHIGLGYSF